MQAAVAGDEVVLSFVSSVVTRLNICVARAVIERPLLVVSSLHPQKKTTFVCIVLWYRRNPPQIGHQFEGDFP